MRALALVCVVGCVIGCGQVLPLTEPPQPWDGIEIEPPPAAALATELAVRFYAGQLGVEPPRHMTVHWTSEQIRHGDQLVSGLCGSCDAIIVWLHGPADEVLLSRTFLAHEIAHCMGADAEHQDPVWWAADGLNNRAHDELSAAGL